MYYEHFGFREPPFNVTPDPRFFYNHSSHQEALATLRYGIEARKGFIVITGEPGTGKTVLLRMLMRSLKPDVRTAFVFNNTRVSFAELLRTVLNDLGLPTLADDRLSLTAQLNDFLLQQLKERRIVSLLIDEAQDLSKEMLEEIRLLSNFETDSAKLLQIVLVGQPRLERTLDGPDLWQLKQRVILRRRLTALSDSEVDPYIDWRLRIAGYEGNRLFEPRAIAKIATYTGGIPRVINVICDNALERAWASRSKVISAEMVDQVARDLQLHDPAQAKVEVASRGFNSSDGEQDLSQHPKTEKRALTSETSRDITRGVRPDDRRAVNRTSMAPKNRPWTGVVTLLSLMIVTATALLFYSHQITRSSWNAPLTSEGNPGILPQSFEPDVVSMAATKPEQIDERFRREQPSERDPSHLAQTADPREAASPEVKIDAKDKELYATAPRDTNHLRKTMRSADAVIQGLEAEPVWSDPKTSRAEFQTRETTQPGSSREVYFELMAVSDVRNRPQPDAGIIASLRPGTWVKLIAEHGDYLQIQSLNDSEIAGYVQRERGLLEPLHVTVPPKSRQSISVASNPSRVDYQILETPKRTRSRDTYFEVMAVSDVRNRPQPDAAIIASLRPGTWVKLIAEHGDYLQIQSLNDSQIAGYVQREHGLLEPLRMTIPPKNR